MHMEEYSIALNGITNPINIPAKFQKVTNTTLCQKNLLNFTEKIADIKKILSIDVKLSIKDGFKNNNKSTLTILGYEKITLACIRNNFSEDIKKLNYNFPFIGEINYPSSNFQINQVYAAVTELKYKLINSNSIILESWIFLAPLIKTLDSHKNSNILTSDNLNYNLKNIDKAEDKNADIVIDYDMNLNKTI